MISASERLLQLYTQLKQKLHLSKPLEKDALFIWIPKTGGTSVYSVLSNYSFPNFMIPHHFDLFTNQGSVTFGHVSVDRLLKEKVISQTYFDNSFKFCFVRNPWDRLVSLFHYLKKAGRLHRNISFAIFCKQVTQERITPIGLYNSIGLSQCNPQSTWVTDKKGKLIVDFVGKYESLESDFAKICGLLDIHKKLPHLNKTNHKDYRSYYDKTSKRLVEDFYKQDIQLFNYQF